MGSGNTTIHPNRATRSTPHHVPGAIEVELRTSGAPLPQGLLTRPPTLQDAPAVVDLLNRCSTVMTAESEETIDTLTRFWATPGLDIASDILLVTLPDGKAVGYGEVVARDDPPVTIYVWARVDPEWEGQGIGTYLLEWCEHRARQELHRVPEGIRSAIQAQTLSTYAPAVALLEAYGMQRVRHFWRMMIEFDGAPPLPTLPDGIRIRTYDEVRDPRAVFRAREESFRDHWGYVEQPEERVYEWFAHHTLNDPGFDGSLWFLAMDGDEIAAIALCQRDMPEDKELGWINILGVRPAWRRQGLGLALLRYAFGEFYRRGLKRVGLGVDASSLTGATRLYEKAGMRAVRQYTAYEKVLQQGRDLARRA